MSRVFGRRAAVLAVSVVLACVPGHLACAQDCTGDVNGDTTVNVTDLLALLGAWGPCDAPCPPCAEDFNGDCTVNVSDLLELLSSWGPCPEPCDPTGTWVADEAIQYSCIAGFLIFDIQALVLNQSETILSALGSPSFHSFGEVVMTGDSVTCDFGASIILTAVLPGDCNEIYTLEGTFITENQFVATITFEFEGGESCFECVEQEFTRVFNRK